MMWVDMQCLPDGDGENAVRLSAHLANRGAANWRRQNRRRNCIEGVHMPILTWVFLGLIAGFIGSKIVNRTGEGLLLDIVLGVVGAVVGGWLFNTFGHAGVSGLNLYSIMVAVVGAIVVLVIYHAMVGGRRRLV
jgi:uncharacterized membrane protein YeaQ/YmgE (transglycosylase-associated protein family)